MTENNSLEKLLLKADPETALIRDTILRRLHVVNFATDQEHLLNRHFVVTPAPIKNVVERVEVPFVEEARIPSSPMLHETIDTSPTTVYSSDRNLAYARSIVEEAYEAAA